MDSQLLSSYPQMGVNRFKMLTLFESALKVTQFQSNAEHYTHEECADEKRMNWDGAGLNEKLVTNIDDPIRFITIVFEHLSDKRRAILYQNRCWNTDILRLPSSD